MQTRLLAVQLAAELFARSQLFRKLLSSNFTEFLEFAIGFRQSKPLPDPPQVAEELRETTLENLESWNEEYGNALPQVWTQQVEGQSRAYIQERADSDGSKLATHE